LRIKILICPTEWTDWFVNGLSHCCHIRLALRHLGATPRLMSRGSSLPMPARCGTPTARPRYVHRQHGQCWRHPGRGWIELTSAGIVTHSLPWPQGTDWKNFLL